MTGFPEEQLHEIVDFAGLIERLREVSLDHPLHPVGKRTAALLTPDANFGDLDDRVLQFVGNPACDSLLITIRYTDDGFSLNRRDDGSLEMHFYLRPRRRAQDETAIRALFAAEGIQPHTDHLSDEGRTRILGFAAPQDGVAAVKLCRRILVQAYHMRADDSLRYTSFPRNDAEAAI